MLNEYSIFIVCTILYIGILNKFIFKGYLFWIRNSKIPIFIRLLLILAFFPITLIGLVAYQFWDFIDMYPASISWMFLFSGILYLLILELLYLPHAKFKILFFTLIILPLCIIYPKSLENKSCKREAPLSQDSSIWNTKSGIWKGKEVRFEIAQDKPDRNPKLYNIYNLQTNELIESDVEISELPGKNNCAGLEFQSRVSTIDAKGYGTVPACIGIPVKKCELDKDYTSKANGFYVSQ